MDADIVEAVVESFETLVSGDTLAEGNMNTVKNFFCGYRCFLAFGYLSKLANT